MNHSETVQQAEGKPIAAPSSNPARSAELPTLLPEKNAIHLHPTTTLAERVLLPGDPGRALALAQLLLESPLMFNHNRGLWGYTGMAEDGEPLTIQSTGMGGPSAAIVLHELISLGVTRAIRVGTCGALDPRLGLGDLVVAREAIAADGTSLALGAKQLAFADPTLAEALARGAGSRLERTHHEGRIVSTDLFYERDSTRNTNWQAEGALAVEMEAATLFTLGATTGIQVGCLLVVSDNLHPDIQPPGYKPELDVGDNLHPDIQPPGCTHGSVARIRIDDQALAQAAEAMGSIALGALSA
ncbi:MAG: hypothetical protein WAU77_07840 [Solirubrobacteraceae bacterium]